MNHIEYLKRYQAWRTGELDMTMDEAGITPAGISTAINMAIKDVERLDSRCIQLHERNDMGEEYMVEHRGVNLRDTIDAAIKAKA